MNLFRPHISTKRQIHFFDLLLLVAVSAFVIFPALGQNRRWASREIRHAEIIREMAENGDYLIPRLIGEIYYDKPPVMHAAAAALTRIVGKPSMTIARLPSAIAGVLGVLATYWLGILLLDRRVALLGAIALLGMPGYSLMAREARPDMILCSLILFSCLCLGLCMKERRHFPRTSYLALAGLLAGLGVVTKGPYALLSPLFFVVFVPFRRQDLKRPRLGLIAFGLGVIAAIAIWAIPVYLRDGGEYLRGVISQPDLDVSKGEGGRHLYYIRHGLLLSLPLSLFLPLSVVDMRRNGYSPMLSISGAIFTVVSCIPKKRKHYLLPFYPFFALGIATSIIRYSKTNWIVRRAAWVLIPLSVIVIPFYYTIILPIMHPPEDSEMVFAKEVLSVIEPDAKVYCVNSEEALAWVGRQHERIHKLPIDLSAGQVLLRPEPRSYLIIDNKNLGLLLKVIGPFQHEQILSRTIDQKKIILFRLTERAFELE